MSFSTPIYYSYAGILSKEPESKSDAFAFLKAFNSEVKTRIVNPEYIILLLISAQSETLTIQTDNLKSLEMS